MMRVLCAWFFTMLFACAALAAPKAAETGHWSCYDALRFVKAAQKLAPAVVEQLKAGQFQAIVAELRSATAAGPQKAELRYEALRLALEEDPKLAAGLCDFLARDSSLESATMRAETLLLAATAVVAGGQYSPKISGLNDALAGRAASLLDHSDPFVRGIAEWAIAVRVNRENDGSKMAWPRRNPPAWFTRWQAVEAKNLLNYDYVRQAVQQNMHRTVADLRASGDQVVARAEKLATAISAAKGLAEVKAAHGRLAAAADLSSARLRWVELRHAARELVLASPDLAFQQLVFCKRRNHLGQHNIANYAFHQARMPAGGDVLIKRGFDPATPAESLLRGRLGEGNIRGMDLFYDADRLVFAFSPWPDPNDPKTAEPTHLYEMKVDGSGLRQLTDDPLFIDCEPAYLPNGDVVFASDRGRVGSECGPWDQNATVLNLYRVSSDGKSIKRLSYNKDFDAYPHVLNDGSIGFLRWDYQERHFYYPHGLWTIRPDGTGCDMLFKGHVSTGPYSFRDAMPIPGSGKLFGIACGHHSLAEGALALLDPAHGVNTLQGFSYVTPFASDTEGGYGPNLSAVPEGGVRDAVGPGRGGYYHTPWPLSERSVLVGYDYHHPNSCAFGIYYVDVFGNKELIHRDRLYELAHPLAIKARPRPPMMPDVDAEGHQLRNLLHQRCLRGPARCESRGRQVHPHPQPHQLGLREDAGGRAALDARPGQLLGLRLLDLVAHARDRHGAGGGGWLGPLQGPGATGADVPGAG